MRRVKAASEREKNLKEARHGCITGLEPSIRSAAQTYGLPYRTMRDRLQGAKPRAETHNREQTLSIEDEKAIVRFCVALDGLGHPLRGSLVKAFAVSLLPPAQQR